MLLPIFWEANSRGSQDVLWWIFFVCQGFCKIIEDILIFMHIKSSFFLHHFSWFWATFRLILKFLSQLKLVKVRFDLIFLFFGGHFVEIVEVILRVPKSSLFEFFGALLCNFFVAFFAKKYTNHYGTANFGRFRGRCFWTSVCIQLTSIKGINPNGLTIWNLKFCPTIHFLSQLWLWKTSLCTFL